MPAFLISLLTAVVPLLVQEAERIIGKGAPDAANPAAGNVKHQWVTDAVNDFIGVLETKVPDWVKPDMEQLKPVLDQAIEEAVAKL